MRTTPNHWRTSAYTLAVAAFAMLGCVGGCSSAHDSIRGRWAIDVSASLRTNTEEASIAMVPKLKNERLKEIADGFIIDFDRENQVVLTRAGKSIIRTYEVVKSKDNTYAISLDMGPSNRRRVVLTRKGSTLVVIDSHRRIVLRKL